MKNLSEAGEIITRKIIALNHSKRVIDILAVWDLLTTDLTNREALQLKELDKNSEELK